MAGFEDCRIFDAHPDQVGRIEETTVIVSVPWQLFQNAMRYGCSWISSSGSNASGVFAFSLVRFCSICDRTGSLS